jgi:WD40 repeat protein
MFRPKIKGNESDRFITARSTDRDQLIDRYNLTEKKEINDSHSPIPRDRSRTPTRTAFIIKDEKQVSEKVYQSLLKTQLLRTARKEDTQNSYLSSSNNLSKKRMKFFTRQNRSPDRKIEGEELTPGNLAAISRKLNFNNVKTDIKAKRGRLEDVDFNRQDQFKNSFKDLIDFNLAQEDIKNIPEYNVKKLPTSAYKVLDAPALKDDFYLHLIDWSTTDVLAVGLGNSVYMWNASDSSVDLVKEYEHCNITSVNWLSDGKKLTVGLCDGSIDIYDTETKMPVLNYLAHAQRVGVLSSIPNDECLFSSGSLDRMINTFDIRVKSQPMLTHVGHSQEVCGLKWSRDGRMLASGGNDNRLMLWNLKKHTCENKFNAHNSAVRAIDWSYHKYGLLASGGGTQDRTIKFWNTNEMKLIDSIDTTSQVCDIAFSKITNEFVTTHGYSDNLILIWDYSKMEVIATLKGHKERVLYLSVSPDGKKIVTGAGDESIRFWEVFKREESKLRSPKLKLFNIR